MFKTVFCEKVQSLHILVRRKSATRENHHRSLKGHAMLPHHTKLGKVFPGIGGGGGRLENTVDGQCSSWFSMLLIYSTAVTSLLHREAPSLALHNAKQSHRPLTHVHGAPWSFAAQPGCPTQLVYRTVLSPRIFFHTLSTSKFTHKFSLYF